MKRVLLIVILLSCSSLGPPCLHAADARSSPSFAAGDAGACHVTRRPEKRFVPPSPYPYRPSDPVSFWFGGEALWTQVWAPPPWSPWTAGRVTPTFWASAKRLTEAQPTLVVSIKRLDSDEPPVSFAAPDSVYFDPERLGMNARLSFPSAGCWQVTGKYQEKSLSYVVLVEADDSRSDEAPHAGESDGESSADVFGRAMHSLPEMGPVVPVGISLVNGIDCSQGCKCSKFWPDGPLHARDPLGPCTKDQEKRIRDRHERWLYAFAPARHLLLKQGVPFDPDILFEYSWRTTLEPVLDQMPEMKQNLRPLEISGVVMADTLYVSGPISSGRTAVIIVNHVVTEGCRYGFTDTPVSEDFHIYVASQGRLLGMSLDEALSRNGLSRNQFSGKDHLPPFSVIRDLDLPNVCKNAGVQIGSQGTAPNPAAGPKPTAKLVVLKEFALRAESQPGAR